jgi:hypothetical protein
MDEESILPFELPAVARKKVSVGFVLLLRGIERRLGRIIGWRLSSFVNPHIDKTHIPKPSKFVQKMTDYCEAVVSLNSNEIARTREHLSGVNFLPQFEPEFPSHPLAEIHQRI